MSQKNPIYTNLSITKDEKKSEVTITAEIPLEQQSALRTQALERLGKGVKIDGFRPGHIPEAVLVKHIGEGGILSEMAELGITKAYAQIAESEDLHVIGTPQVNLTKLAPENPIGFTLTAALLPELTLPDYKQIAKDAAAKQPEVTVTQDEVDDTITHLKRERAKIERIEAGTEPAKATEEVATLKPEELPELDDEFVKGFGYDSLEIFTEKLRENIKSEKTRHEREKTRISIIEEVIKNTTLNLPDILIESELGIMESHFAHDLAHGGTTLENYLKETKKTREDLHKEWRDAAKKRASMHLIIREIAEKENIVPDEAQVNGEVEHILSHTKDADPMNVRAYVMQTMRSELVFRFLEEQK